MALIFPVMNSIKKTEQLYIDISIIVELYSGLQGWNYIKARYIKMPFDQHKLKLEIIVL